MAVWILCMVACNGNGSSGEVQDPVTFTFTNPLQETFYADWAGGGIGSLVCEKHEGDLWKPQALVPEFCTPECTEENLGQMCCMDCGLQAPAARVIEPGDTIEIPWNGMFYKTDNDHCTNCGCWRTANPSGTYRVRFCMHDTVECYSLCEPDADGIIHNAQVSGTSVCFKADVSMPTAEVVITIADEL